MKPKRVLVLILALIFVLSGLQLTAAADENPAAAVKTITYTPDFATIFSNPERGFCHYIGIQTPNSFPNSDILFSYRPYLTSGAVGAITSRIMHSYIYLGNYVDTPTLPQVLLDDLASGLTEVRREGMKINLRCAYTMSMDRLVDVPLDIIMSHMKQINKVISANADVVLAIEAGYFGPHGEWHDNPYTTWEDRTGTPNPEGKSARATLVKGILETTPDNIKVVIRYPDYLKELLENDILTEAEKNRLGFHNDGIAQREDDGGTYPPDIQAWRKYAYGLTTSDGFHRYYGGETGIDPASEGYLDGYKVLEDSYNTNMTDTRDPSIPALFVWCLTMGRHGAMFS